MTRALLVTAVATLLAAVLTGTGWAAPPPGPAVPPLAWGKCDDGSPPAQAGFQCATATVPLDHRDPRGRTISLAVVRKPATGPRIGSLFLNPGGPGGTGTGQITSWVNLVPAGLADRFDLVSWDPRGVGESTAVQCFDSQEAEGRFLGDSADYPTTPAQATAYVDTWRRFGQACAARDRALLEHSNTADTARDLDLLRQAVGDAKLTYLGLSYGTFLGATYANMFPDKVRAMVLDGNLAPSAWTDRNLPVTTRSISMRVGSDAGASSVFGDLLRLCGQVDTSRCAFSMGSPQATVERWNQLLARLQKGPIWFAPRNELITGPALVSRISNGLDIAFPFTSPVSGGGSAGWAGVAAGLKAIWDARDAPLPPVGPDGPLPPPSSYDGPEQGYAVTCGDAAVPPPGLFGPLARVSQAANGPFGLNAVWGDEPCSTWPVRAADPYRGPFNRNQAPILVLGPTRDPSTPFQNSVLMSTELRNARLLTVVGYGHTSLLNPSRCAPDAERAYLVDGTLPRPGTVCRQDATPFGATP
ncbi:alpha/beta hydrolase [Actinomycetospora sp. OC33-EN08]|uniref:Alpha/beta hydrolase n=1 Tax=Actinomycetospora aurantiaca TaxID=3129233 RepID=A0ABU8MKC0_9PSEU